MRIKLLDGIDGFGLVRAMPVVNFPATLPLLDQNGNECGKVEIQQEPDGSIFAEISDRTRIGPDGFTRGADIGCSWEAVK